jgi:hypothetical protein
VIAFLAALVTYKLVPWIQARTTAGMKEAISDTFKSYKERGYNHIAENRVEELIALPEFPQR